MARGSAGLAQRSSRYHPTRIGPPAPVPSPPPPPLRTWMAYTAVFMTTKAGRRLPVGSERAW